ncbi:alpha/beta-hydrolase [Ascodesmis nigricans]|uniref:Alpha/beta-hydrolase n=1 Tax=Ascodesmis nigricans TaxID=341454 RepID=A0A4S2MR46_9PEZI|nr:alpha/beta-hydrolase [Ascodesmis nigricans]
MTELTATVLPYSHHTQLPTGTTIAARSRNLDSARDGTIPIFILLHGYPQTSHQFRYLISLLPSHFPLYIPDLVGYGNSTLPASLDTSSFTKRAVGTALLSSLSHLLSLPTDKKLPIVLIGHDRGARIAHRLAVDNNHANFSIVGTVLLDIVPTIVQFDSLKDPKVAAGTFHWPFLAAGNGLPEAMISAYGGGKFCRDLVTKWGGSVGGDPVRWGRVLEGMRVYEEAFERESVIKASCEDYRAAAIFDGDEQVEDQRVGRKLKGPVLVLFSEKYLGSRYDVGEVWREWVDPKEGRLLARAIGHGVGHFVTEEAPAEIAEVVREWVEKELKGVVQWTK